MNLSLFFTLTCGVLAVSPAAHALDGAAIFKANCVTCHGDQMDGNGPAGQYMNPKPRNLKKDKFKAGDDKDSIIKTVTNGLPNTAMVGLSAQLKPDEIATVADFVCSQRNSCEKKAGKKKKGK